MNDPFDLERFVKAQDSVYARVCGELRSGHKRSHWMWFIFPQLRGLGHSSMAYKYGIASRGETEAYLRHPLLGPRLIECTQFVNEVEGHPIEQILGYPDNLKFHSSITLFAQVAQENEVFASALRKYFGGQLDQLTLSLL